MFTFNVYVSGPDVSEELKSILERLEAMAVNIDELIKKVHESNTIQDGIIASNQEIAALIRKHIANQSKLEELAKALEEQAPETAAALKANLDLKTELEALDKPVEPPVEPPTEPPVEPPFEGRRR